MILYRTVVGILSIILIGLKLYPEVVYVMPINSFALILLGAENLGHFRVGRTSCLLEDDFF